MNMFRFFFASLVQANGNTMCLLLVSSYHSSLVLTAK